MCWLGFPISLNILNQATEVRKEDHWFYPGMIKFGDNKGHLSLFSQLPYLLANHITLEAMTLG